LRALDLSALDVARGMSEDRVLAAVVEMQVRIDHQIDIGRAHVDVTKRVGDGAIYHTPVAEHLIGSAHAGVAKQCAARVGDDEPVDRPLLPVYLKPGGVQPLDLEHVYRLSSPASYGLVVWPPLRSAR